MWLKREKRENIEEKFRLKDKKYVYKWGKKPEKAQKAHKAHNISYLGREKKIKEGHHFRPIYLPLTVKKKLITAKKMRADKYWRLEGEGVWFFDWREDFWINLL
jgi:hypothetical protein